MSLKVFSVVKVWLGCNLSLQGSPGSFSVINPLISIVATQQCLHSCDVAPFKVLNLYWDSLSVVWSHRD